MSHAAIAAIAAMNRPPNQGMRCHDRPRGFKVSVDSARVISLNAGNLGAFSAARRCLRTTCDAAARACTPPHRLRVAALAFHILRAPKLRPRFGTPDLHYSCNSICQTSEERTAHNLHFRESEEFVQGDAETRPASCRPTCPRAAARPD